MDAIFSASVYSISKNGRGQYVVNTGFCGTLVVENSVENTEVGF